MRTYEGIENFPKLHYPVVTSGTFDGVHVGHQKIISRITELARANSGETVLLTFWPHPRFVLNPGEKNLKLLSTFEEKASYLKKSGLDHLVKIPFTREFSQLSSEAFIRKILIDKIGTKKLVIGYDHRFGKNREGSFEHLKSNEQSYGFEVEEIPKQEVDDVGVSSTKIRNALEAGEIEAAKDFLGRDYSLAGEVQPGNKIGRKIGFPTANLMLAEGYKMVPGDGAYAVEVMHKAHLYKGMLNIGYRPTVDGLLKTIEVHIFDFDNDLYNQELRVFFVKRIRQEIKFKDLNELKEQLLKDSVTAKKILNKV